MLSSACRGPSPILQSLLADASPRVVCVRKPPSLSFFSILFTKTAFWTQMIFTGEGGAACAVQDAKVALDVHHVRESYPHWFLSQMGNKLWYTGLGAGETLSHSCSNLASHVIVSALWCTAACARERVKNKSTHHGFRRRACSI